MDATTAGAIQTAFNLSNAFALLAASWLSDSLGARRMYLVCTWAGAAALVVFAIFARSPHAAGILIVFVGLTQGGAYAPALLLVADLSAPSRRGRAMGQMLAAGSFGYLLSVILSMWVAKSCGPAAAFAICATGALAGAMVDQISLKGVENRRHERKAEVSAEPLPWSSIFG
ncbi:MFS transporter, partial [Paraburkholderia sp. UYCP14C]|uniref:MFS transporter n=1 Tax=Paraburkholderia sp. UYCP14C TaxID=2511130 RepID=UPI0027D249DD